MGRLLQTISHERTPMVLLVGLRLLCRRSLGWRGVAPLLGRSGSRGIPRRCGVGARIRALAALAGRVCVCAWHIEHTVTEVCIAVQRVRCACNACVAEPEVPSKVRI